MPPPPPPPSFIIESDNTRGKVSPLLPLFFPFMCVCAYVAPCASLPLTLFLHFKVRLPYYNFVFCLNL